MNVLRIRLTIALATVLAPLLAYAAETPPFPILNAENLVGSWEALYSPSPLGIPYALYHLEINKSGDSFLTQTTIGESSCIVRRLLSSEIKDGIVTLHFASASVPELTGSFPEMWMTATGYSGEKIGAIEATIKGRNDKIYFSKGTWTRDVAEASKKAEEEIKKAAAAKP